MKIGDRVSLREASKGKKVFENLDERLKEVNVPSWLSLDPLKKEGVIKGVPKPDITSGLDFTTVLEYYKR
jgi:hypothetical protein